MTNRICSTCRIDKSKDAFRTKVQGGREYLVQPCRDCEKAYKRTYNAATQESRSTYRRAWYKRNQEAVLAKAKSNWIERGYNHLRQCRRYDITPGQYDLMYVNQLGRCAICSDVLEYQAKGTHIDHNHSTGAVRALLCLGCNVAIGHMDESPSRLRAAANYLEGHWPEAHHGKPQEVNRAA